MGAARRLWHKLDTPSATLLVVLGLYLAFFLARLADLGGDVSRFVVAGSRFTSVAEASSNLYVLRNSSGYDGQFYYRLAIDPFTGVVDDYGIRLDAPAYRQQRILYPLLAHTAALGRAELVPMAMVAVNLLAAAFLGWLAGLVAQAWGRHALSGLALALYPGLILVFDRDLTELTESLFLTATLLALIRRESWLATTSLCLAVLAKETALGMVFAVFAAWIWAALRHSGDGPRWHTWAIPGAVYVGWQAWIWHNWGAIALTKGVVRSNVQTSLSSAHLPAFADLLMRELPQRSLIACELLALIAFVVLALVALQPSRAPLTLKLAFLGYAALGAVIKHYWGGDWAFLRALSELWMIGATIILAWRSRLASYITPVTLASWCVLALHVILFR